MNLSRTAPRRLHQCTASCVMGGSLVLVLMIATTGAAEVRPATGGRQATSRTVVDPSVRPAGGAACRECGHGGCRHGHHRDCRDGVCVPYCPVRPGTFGFYGTQWRRWPGQGVVPVSNVEAATPVQPPKSAVPGVDEESFGPKPDELPEPGGASGPAAEAAGQPVAPEPDASPAVPPSPATEREDAPREMPRETPQDVLPPSKPAETETPPAKPKGDDLFDDSAARKVRRKIPVQSGSVSRASGEPSGVKTTSHESSVRETAKAPRPVPRVAFDPPAETARLRGTR